MILTERTINIIDHESIMDSPVVLYRGDKNVELKLNIKSSRFKFRDDDSSNFIESAQASYGQLIIQTPNQNEPIFSEITATKKGYIIFVITAEMIDEIDEVGKYTFQVRLLDSNKRSRATIPPVVNGIEIREPITSEDSNALNSAIVGLASAANEEVLDTFDEHGDYAKTNWKFGDKITAAKLNKSEDGIYQSYALGMNNNARINNLARLPEGSTTGDAELIDGRIGVDGFAYDNIGSAIRKQINELKNGNVNSKSITIDKLSDARNDITYKKVICKSTSHFSAFSFSIDNAYSCENSVIFNATLFSKNKDITVQVNIVKDGDSTTYESNQITIYKGIRTDCNFTINVNMESNQTIYAYIIINSIGNTVNEIEIINPKIVCDTKTLDIYGKGVAIVQGCTLSKKEESYLGLGRYGNFYDKKILFLGDSITDTSWANMYPYYISEITGAKNINYAVASSGYGMNAYYAHNIWGKNNTSIPAMVQRAYDDGIIDVDLVVVAGGTNDWDFGVPLGEFNDIYKAKMTTPSLYFSVAQTIKKLFYLYPYTPIQVLSPIPRNQPNGSGDQYNPKNNGKTLVDFSNAIKEVCEYYSVPFMNNLLSSNIKLNDEKNRGIYTQDGLHPTDFYSKIYAKMVISEISKWL